MVFLSVFEEHYLSHSSHLAGAKCRKEDQMKVFVLTLIIFSLSACSSIEQKRSPASLSSAQPAKTCSQLASSLLRASGGERSFHQADFSYLETDWVDREPVLKGLVDLNRNPELQQRSRYILALLEKNYPGEGAQQLAQRYRQLFKECS